MVLKVLTWLIKKGAIMETLPINEIVFFVCIPRKLPYFNSIDSDSKNGETFGNIQNTVIN